MPEWMIQFALAGLGLTALTLAMGTNPTGRKFAPLVGLAGQPFWFAATIPAGQWGMVALCAAYTAVYAWGVWRHWAPKQFGIPGKSREVWPGTWELQRRAWFRRDMAFATALLVAVALVVALIAASSGNGAAT